PLFLFPAPPPPATSPLSLHDALPIWPHPRRQPVEHPVGRVLSVHPRDRVEQAPDLVRLVLLQDGVDVVADAEPDAAVLGVVGLQDRKSTRLNSSHRTISYAVFCLKKK